MVSLSRVTRVSGGKLFNAMCLIPSGVRGASMRQGCLVWGVRDQWGEEGIHIGGKGSHTRGIRAQARWGGHPWRSDLACGIKAWVGWRRHLWWGWRGEWPSSGSQAQAGWRGYPWRSVMAQGQRSHRVRRKNMMGSPAVGVRAQVIRASMLAVGGNRQLR